MYKQKHLSVFQKRNGATFDLLSKNETIFKSVYIVQLLSRQIYCQFCTVKIG